MASIPYLEGLLAGLPVDMRKTMFAFVRAAFKSMSFGTPDAVNAVASVNFGGNLIPVAMSGTPDQEVAVYHQLQRVPRFILPALNPNAVGASTPVLTVTRAADATFLYLSTDVASAEILVYVE